MKAQAEEMTQRVHAARTARLSAQRMRQLAAERAEKLERELKNAAEAGLRAEISRTLDARARLQSGVKRKSFPRNSGIIALALLLGAATSGLAWVAMQKTVTPGQTARQAPVLGTAPGDPLKLAYSYSVSQPAAR